MGNSDSIEESKEITNEINQFLEDIHKKSANERNDIASTIIGWVTNGRRKYRNKYRTILSAVSHYEQFDKPEKFKFLENLIYELILLQPRYRIPEAALFAVALGMRSWKTRKDREGLTKAKIKMCEAKARVIHKVFNRLGTRSNFPSEKIVALQLFAVGPYPNIGVEKIVRDLLTGDSRDKIKNIVKIAASGSNKRRKELANLVAHGLSEPMYLNEMENLLNLSLTERKIRYTYLIAPLLSYLADSEFLEEEKEVRTRKKAMVDNALNKIDNKQMGSLDQETLEILVKVCSYSLIKYDSREYAKKFLNTLITEGKNDLVPIILPLFMYANRGNKHAKELLETAVNKMTDKPFGRRDSETLKKLAHEISYALEGEDGEVRQCANRIFRRIMEEGKNNLIYFVLPLVETASYSSEGRENAKKLLEELVTAPSLGKADKDTRKKLAEKLLLALECEEGRECSKKLLLKIIKEGKNDLAEFVRPLIQTTATGQYDYEGLYSIKGGENFTNLKICFDGPLFDALNENKPKYGLAREIVEVIKITPELPPEVLESIGNVLDSIVCVAARGLLEDMTGPHIRYDKKSGLKYIEFSSIADEYEPEKQRTEFLVVIDKNEATKAVIKEVFDALKAKVIDSGDQLLIEKLINAGIEKLLTARGTEEQKKRFESFVKENKGNYITFVAYPLNAVKDPVYGELAKKTLDIIMETQSFSTEDDNKLNYPTRAARDELVFEEGRDYSKKVLLKIISDNEGRLIPLISTLFWGTKQYEDNETCRNIIAELLERIVEKDMGEMTSKKQKIISKMFENAIHNPKQKDLVESLLDKLERRGIQININKNYEGPKWRPKSPQRGELKDNGKIKNRC